MTSVDVLRRARTLLVEDGWCRGVLRDASGARCLVAAVVDAGQAATMAFHEVRAEIGGRSLAAFNDVHTFSEILTLLDLTIARLEAVPS